MSSEIENLRKEVAELRFELRLTVEKLSELSDSINTNQYETINLIEYLYISNVFLKETLNTKLNTKLMIDIPSCDVEMRVQNEMDAVLKTVKNKKK